MVHPFLRRFFSRTHIIKELPQHFSAVLPLTKFRLEASRAPGNPAGRQTIILLYSRPVPARSPCHFPSPRSNYYGAFHEPASISFRQRCFQRGAGNPRQSCFRLELPGQPEAQRGVGRRGRARHMVRRYHPAHGERRGPVRREPGEDQRGHKALAGDGQALCHLAQRLGAQGRGGIHSPGGNEAEDVCRLPQDAGRDGQTDRRGRRCHARPFARGGLRGSH